MSLRRKSIRRKSIAAITATAAALSLSACGAGNDKDTITIGTTDADQKQWKVFEQELDKAGVKAKIQSFNDYNIPNQSLIDGQTDINNFQHMMFLAQYNTGNNSDLVPVGATEIVPLALYFKDHKDVKDVEKAGEVAIPNDSTNQGRAINLLAQNKLVTLKKEGLLTPTPADIDTGKSKVKVTPVDAAQTATSYLDGTPAVINNSFLSKADIDPKSAVLQDDPKNDAAKPYINGFVTTKEHQDDPQYQKLVDIWHSKPVQDAVNEESGGTSVEVKMGGKELEKILTDTEKKLKEQGQN